MLRIQENRLPLPDTLIESLSATEQNPRYHAEGNVYNHTLLVLEQFFQHHQRFNLSEEEKEILYWVAILHDIGKPSVTKWQKGRWTSHGHEKAGVPLAREILLSESEVSPEDRRQILDLIRWHNAPLRWVIRQQTGAALQNMATQVNLRLLGIFAYFDIMGRICERKSEIIDGIEALNDIHIPKVESEIGSYAALQKVYLNASLQKKNALWSAQKQNDPRLLQKLLQSEDDCSMQRTHLQCVMGLGAGGAAQSEYLQQYYPSHLYYRLDELFTEGENKQQRRNKMREVKRFLSVYLRGRRNVVLDCQGLNEKDRREIGEFVRQNNSQLHYVFFERSLKALTQKASDEEEVQKITQAYQQLILPHPWEAHTLEIC